MWVLLLLAAAIAGWWHHRRRPAARRSRHRTLQRTTRTTATSSTVTEEEARPAPGTDVAVVTPDEQGVRPPLPHRRMVLMTMLATAGYDPDVEAIGGMDEDQVDAAIEALIAHERAARSASHTY